MAKQPETAADRLTAAQEKLKSAHAKLVKEFEKLHAAKFSAVNHRVYLEKLKAHLLALEAHTAAIHAQHEALHARREALHEEHEATDRAALSPQKPRSTGPR